MMNVVNNEQMDKLLYELEQAPNDTALAKRAYEKAYCKLHHRHHFSRLGSFAVYAQRIAAVLVIPVATALVISLNHKEPEWNETIVPNGKNETIELSDGTSIILNSGSRVTYPKEFYGNTREIFIDGEILADVSKNKNKPFIVHSGDICVKVHGTKFNLKAYGNDSQIGLHLLEGSVSVEQSNDKSFQSVLMAKGDYVVYDKLSKTFDKQTFELGDFHSFANSKSHYFYKMTMRDIANELERSFGTRIVVTDELLAQNRILAWFSNGESLPEILNSLNMDGKMAITDCGSTIYLSSKQ